MEYYDLRETSYSVGAGDTLYGIAKKKNTTVQKIRELNNLTSDVIVPGQILIIQEEEAKPQENIEYVVKKGDSLYNIAQKYGSTVEEIKRYNNLSSDNLSIGQILTIPAFPSQDISFNSSISNYVHYTVEKNDSLYSIAQKFGTTVEEIKKDNNLVSDELAIGTTLILRDNTGISSIEECLGEDYYFPTDFAIYTVQKGDNLYSIAKKFNTSVGALEELNNIDALDMLSIGQEIKIPPDGYVVIEPSESFQTYTVKKGDRIFMGNNE